MTWFSSLMGPNSILWGLGAVAIAALVAFVRSSTKASVEAKYAKEEQKARDVADEIDSDVHYLPGAVARDELHKRFERR